MKEIDNPFDGEVERYIREKHTTEQVARDFVVLCYLNEGDTRALAHLLQRDYSPGDAVKRFLSLMLQPERQAVNDPKKTIEISTSMVPYGLKAFRRDGQKGRPLDPVAAERNQAIKDRYDQIKERIGHGGHESAILELKDLLGKEIKESAIREAVKARSPKSKS